jgi:hypothetical protein
MKKILVTGAILSLLSASVFAQEAAAPAAGQAAGTAATDATAAGAASGTAAGTSGGFLGAGTIAGVSTGTAVATVPSWRLLPLPLRTTIRRPTTRPPRTTDRLTAVCAPAQIDRYKNGR